MITVRFSCKECGLVDVPCQVRARESEENVVSYVRDVVGRAIMEQHGRLSLLCEATSCQDVKIPVDAADPDGWIGKQTSIIPPASSGAA